LIRYLALSPEGEDLQWNGRPVKSIALIHCVGSRQVEGVHQPQADGVVNPYCSRVCCTASLHMANDLHERFPQIHLFDFYQDMRTYGRGHEQYYTQACEKGVRFLRYHQDELPEVVAAPAGDSHPVLVKVKDYLTWGEELEVPVDLVVLATGFMPRSIDPIIRMLKISPGNDRFLLEVHPKLRPVETAVPGVVLAGTAQGPMNIQESTAAASAAAAKVAGLLGQGQVELEPYVAQVDADKCEGTGACVEVCHYEDAIRLQEFALNGKTVRRAVVTPANCSGCGACVSACPNGAIDVQGWTLEQYFAMVDALSIDIPDLERVR
jgi:heterodisulfide reductase subunit A